MPSLSEEAAAYKPRNPCGIGKLIDAGTIDYDELLAAFIDSDVQTSGIVRALWARGIPIDAQALRRHRNNECTVCRAKGRFS